MESSSFPMNKGKRITYPLSVSRANMSAILREEPR